MNNKSFHIAFFHNKLDAKQLKTILNEQIKSHREIESFDSTAALASRLIARRNYSFRVQPGFRNFRKMFVSVCRSKEIDISDLMTTISQSITTHKIDGKYSLPTRENFQYLLVRLQSFAKILVRIVACAKKSFEEFSKLVKRGAFLEPATLFMSCAAQIWSVCVKLCHFACESYNGVYPLFEALNSEIVRDFPKDLIVWLGSDWNEIKSPKNERDFNATPKIDTIDLDGFADNSETMAGAVIEVKLEQQPSPEEKCQPTLIVDQKVKKRKVQFSKEHRLVNNFLNMHTTASSSANPANSIDLGESVKRNTATDHRDWTSQKDLLELTNSEEILDFMEREESLRLKRLHEATKRLNGSEWKQFKQRVNCVLSEEIGFNAVKKFRRLCKKRQLLG